MYEDGCQLRDFVHVHDVARANGFAFTAEPVDGAFDVVPPGAPRWVRSARRTAPTLWRAKTCVTCSPHPRKERASLASPRLFTSRRGSRGRASRRASPPQVTNGALTTACWHGPQAADGADVVVYMDADATLDWADLEAVAAPVLSGNADLILGARVPNRREPDAMPWHVALANALLGRLCGRFAGELLTDLGPFRAVRRDALLALRMCHRTYGWLEMVLRATRTDLRVQEVPVAYRLRAGASKVTGRPWPAANTVVKIAWILARHKTAVRRQPLPAHTPDDRHDL